MGTLTYTPAANVTGTATISVRVRDNGGVVNGGVDISAEQTFDIVVSPEVNDAPSFDVTAATSADVNGGPRSVANFVSNVAAGPADEAGQTVTFHIVSNTNPTIFAAAPAVAANGTLTFTPAAIGATVITIQRKTTAGRSTAALILRRFRRLRSRSMKRTSRQNWTASATSRSTN